MVGLQYRPRSVRRLAWIVAALVFNFRQASDSFVAEPSPEMARRGLHSLAAHPGMTGPRARSLSRLPRNSAETPEQELASPARSRSVQAWGVFGVAAYLGYGVKKVVPIVVNGLGAIDAAWQWAFLAVTLVFFAYVEGYKGFTLGFAPRVVSRAWAVSRRAEGERLWRYYNVRAAAKLAKELFQKYGVAYLLTSISLSLVSFSLMYTLVSKGVDVPALLAAVGIKCSVAGKKVGTVALAYALHKAASPIRFPPTVAMTPVVARWMGKGDEEAGSSGAKPSVWHKIFAPAFCIGYFHGTRKRVISSWCVTTIIFAVVVGVKRLPNPYRAILDAGVIVGLAWGVVSILVIWANSLRAGRPPAFDPCLPEGSPYATKPSP